jgi:hypothetical protein
MHRFESLFIAVLLSADVLLPAALLFDALPIGCCSGATAA